MACTSCVNTCLCAVVAGDSSVTVAGSGSGTDPYRITATPTASPIDCEGVQDCVGGMLDTVGFSYDDANGRFQPTSGTVGQALLITGPGTANWGTPASGPSGPTYSPQSITATALGGVQSGTSPMTYGSGQNLEFRAGPGITLTTGLGPWPIVNIGVRTPVANLAAAGFACGDANGAPIYNDPAGGLRTLPPHTSQALLRLTATGGATLAAQTSGGAGSVDRVITNPSPCRAASVHLNHIYRFQSGWPIMLNNLDMGVIGRGSATLGGGALQNFNLELWNPSHSIGGNVPNAALRWTATRTSAITDSFTIAAGGTLTYTVGVDAGNASVPGVFTNVSFANGVETAGILVTQ